jgi:hypothetical protein
VLPDDLDVGTYRLALADRDERVAFVADRELVRRG